MSESGPIIFSLSYSHNLFSSDFWLTPSIKSYGQKTFSDRHKKVKIHVKRPHQIFFLESQVEIEKSGEKAVSARMKELFSILNFFSTP